MQNQIRLALIEARKKAGLTQKDVAQRLGVYDSYVSKYELGKRRVDIVELMCLAKAIGFKASALVSSLERQPPPNSAANAAVDSQQMS